MSDTKIIIGIVSWLVIFSMVVSITVTSMNAYEMGIPEIESLSLVEMEGDTSSTMDFSKLNLTYGPVVIKQGSFNTSISGLTSLDSGVNQIFFMQKRSNEHDLTNRYIILNPEHRDIYIYLYYGSILWVLNTEDYLLISDSGIWIHTGALNHKLISSAITKYDDSFDISTKLTPNDIYEIYLNNQLIYSEDDNLHAVLLYSWESYYGGLKTVGNNVTLSTLETTSTRNIESAGNILQSLFTIGLILKNFFMLVFWTLPEIIFPLWLNVILIKLPAFYLLLIGVKLIRGVGS